MNEPTQRRETPVGTAAPRPTTHRRRWWLHGWLIGGSITVVPPLIFGADFWGVAITEGGGRSLLFTVLGGLCCGTFGFMFGAAIGNVIEAFVLDHLAHNGSLWRFSLRSLLWWFTVLAIVMATVVRYLIRNW